MSKSGKVAARRQFPFEVHNGMRGVRQGDRRFAPTARVPELKPPRSPYVQMSLVAAVEAFTSIGTPGAMLWPLLIHLHREHGGAPFPLPTKKAEEYGISRGSKRNALAGFEKAGLISLQQKGRGSVVVTLLKR